MIERKSPPVHGRLVVPFHRARRVADDWDGRCRIALRKRLSERLVGAVRRRHCRLPENLAPRTGILGWESARSSSRCVENASHGLR
jgi:hypothetical protein